LCRPFRSNAEQARLFAAHPDPKLAGPPGNSLHRLGTELDPGPPSAYGWLATSAPRFGFIKTLQLGALPLRYGRVRSPPGLRLGLP
jgi:hypothetical protein